MSTNRIRLDISYHGRDFSGWAAQPGLRTVQGVLQEWIPRVLRLTEPVELVVAGRTDAGVHARGQVAHLDLPTEVATDSLQHRLSRVLPADLVVRRVSMAPPGFDARFAAVWRRYVYRFDDSGSPDPLLADHVLAVRDRLDVDAMNEAGGLLLGLHDFAAFCKRREGATTIRTLLGLDAVREGPRVAYTVRADAFCHSMVRSLMGALTSVGSGRRDLDWLRQVLATPHRESSVPVLPAHGLCLEEVGYPADDQLAERADQARSRREIR
ncbi:tRNA pseudouridine(38-40) synthase TruA [Enemella evansiae]|uniref:tRNA pseudouridine synthase A n=1 Tax=Enemella evansiae TaxID=2016499 RepID=A0A255GBW3_9ACTN|nr:tRNA pseudouridine(38-40) synthase TruA [Enemella evansiae]OYO13388.1 tRNA pseudouridine(38-40) synthase TruA [Enemella evansiae]